jgi:hypothetical protein
MAKSKHKKKLRMKHRNAAPSAPRAPTVSRAPRVSRKAEPEETPLRRLGYTAAGAAGTALVGTFLAHEGWAPKTIAGLLTAAGSVAAWTSHDATVRNVGAGAMSAAGSQLALLMMDDRDKKPAQVATVAPVKRANADGLPVGALESAFERARARMLVASDDARRYTDAA